MNNIFQYDSVSPLNIVVAPFNIKILGFLMGVSILFYMIVSGQGSITVLLTTGLAVYISYLGLRQLYTITKDVINC